MNMTAEWRPVPGFEGRYEVSSDGLVRSLSRKTRNGPFKKGRTLKPGSMPPSGYRFVNLSRDGAYVVRRIACLVALAFLGPRPEGMVVCHNNGNPKDDRAENLRYDTQSSNHSDMDKHGTRRHGAAVGRKLTPKTVREIRESSASISELAKQYGVSYICVQEAKSRRTWRHVS